MLVSQNSRLITKQYSENKIYNRNNLLSEEHQFALPTKVTKNKLFQEAYFHEQVRTSRETANEIRKDIVTAVHAAKSGHPGGSLSAADIYTYLYFEEIKYRSLRILRKQTATVSFFPKDIQLRDTILHWHTEDSSR